MNNGPLLFLGVLVTLASSFWGLLFAPQMQFGSRQPVLIETTGEFYPPARPGLATKGADVYRSLGCVECHSQQVRQTGAHFDVWVTELTTNLPAAAVAVAKLRRINEADSAKLLSRLPARVANGLAPAEAQALASSLTTAGAKAEADLVNLGPDIARHWGLRMSASQDYLHDYPVQLGQLRLGPDLAAYGSRQTNANAILHHLFDPSVIKGSIMPPYRFLFEKRHYGAGDTLPAGALIRKQPGADKNVKDGEAIIPNEDAVALAEYLLSLKAEASLFEAPVGKVPAGAPAPAP